MKNALPLSFEIAGVHLFSKPKQTVVAMLGVTFGIGMFIALVGLMTGLNQFTEDVSMTSSPDIHIFQEESAMRETILDRTYPEGFNVVHNQKPKNETPKIRNATQIVSLLNRDDRVLGSSPYVLSQVFYNYGPVQLNGNIMGVDILAEDKLFDLRSRMVAGKIEALLNNHNGILMGSGLARKLNVGIGDRVVTTTPQGSTITLKIVGLFQIGIGVIDNVRSYANISTVQTILRKDQSYITDINIKLKERNSAVAVASELQSKFEYHSEDWQTANATFRTGMLVRNIITYSVSLTLLLVAGFGIYNILNMTIYSKMKDIAILKAMGFEGRDVRNIFMVQSLVIGLAGSVAGLVIGYVLSYLISKAPFDGGDVVSLDHFPVNFDPLYYIIGIVFGVGTTAVAGYMPSRKASNVDPIEIIRGQ